MNRGPVPSKNAADGVVDPVMAAMLAATTAPNGLSALSLQLDAEGRRDRDLVLDRLRHRLRAIAQEAQERLLDPRCTEEPIDVGVLIALRPQD